MVKELADFKLEPAAYANHAARIDLKQLMGRELVHKVLDRVRHIDTLRSLEEEMDRSIALLIEFVADHESTLPMIGEDMQKSFIATDLGFARLRFGELSNLFLSISLLEITVHPLQVSLVTRY